MNGHIPSQSPKGSKIGNHWFNLRVWTRKFHKVALANTWHITSYFQDLQEREYTDTHSIHLQTVHEVFSQVHSTQLERQQPWQDHHVREGGLDAYVVVPTLTVTSPRSATFMAIQPEGVGSFMDHKLCTTRLAYLTDTPVPFLCTISF